MNKKNSTKDNQKKRGGGKKGHKGYGKKDFTEEEVQTFTADLKPLLKKVVSLRNDKKNIDEYLTMAEKLQTKIMKTCNVEAKDQTSMASYLHY